MERPRASDVRLALGPKTPVRPLTPAGAVVRGLAAERRDVYERHVCHSHLAMNLLVKFPGIPEEGSTMSAYDLTCDRETQLCRTAMHVWEIHCPACRATGKVPVVRKKKSRIMATCPRCSGLGFVRYVSARDSTEEDSEGFSLMRNKRAGEYYNSKKIGGASIERK